MRSDRMAALQELRVATRLQVKEAMGLHHTMGYSGPVWPEEATRAAEDARLRHDEMLAEFDDVYAIGEEAIEQEMLRFDGMLTEMHREWLEVAWLHRTEGKDSIVLLAMLVAALLDGKVYRAQLAKYMFYLNYRILILHGYSLTDLVWHASEPRNGSIVIKSLQLDMMNDIFESRLTISNPSMRSSYLATKEKPKKVGRELDASLGRQVSDQIRVLMSQATDDEIFECLPVSLWREGYRPEGDRLLLERCMLWDAKGCFSSVTSARPKEYFQILRTN